ncbi:thiosulfate/3-mercaptopyruvate sulfurtransferase [Agromyces hippuratus]|uniref:Thiosulfate/3-mercaptopyruvate sulfurtransferase n=1 Tax=Agromyces hippuratus TaxID=286438 RepID=A0A852WSL8_9MICO|nr:sulfurtransferase [Agromyces hippuratus]NYG21252.1 thiosulfate/3-mercaptopyruvate sulfurtransferase [Agromyces hippuratus]
MPILITADDLAARLASGERIVVLDVRWSLAEPDGTEAYRAGHIPGAVYVDLDHELADHDVTGEGRHPLPTEVAFTGAMRRWGVRDGDTVVVMDDLGNQSSARAWWLLRHAGVADVRMLDGGLDAWRAAGHPLETGDVTSETGDATARFGGMPVIGIDGAAAFPATGVLLDARGAPRYRGEVEPIDPRAGHIPGARSAPSGENLDADGRFKSAEALREHFASVGVIGEAPVAAYCGSGVTAAHEVAALAIAGIDAALYPGSWSQWSNDETRPVATGASPVE